MKKLSNILSKSSSGFTIIEMLITIVVIGIVATIVTVSYIGITQRATESTLKSDLNNALGELNLFRTENSKYPTVIDDCPNTDPAAICLKASGDNVYEYYVDNTSTPKTFLLIASNGDLAYFIDDTLTYPAAYNSDYLITAIGNISGTPEEGGTLTAGSITPVGADVTYQWKRATTQDGTYTNISGATSLTYLLTSEDVGKYIKVTATGASPYTGSVSSVAVGPVQNNMSPPSTPTVVVTLSSPNVLATASVVTCTTGTAQYGLRSRTNDGAWSAYSAWSTTRTATQTANDGVKYGYQAQARCYVDVGNISSIVTSVESTYIDPIATPATLTVTNSSTSTTTTWSWSAPTCPSGTSARYQYRYTNSQGYDSGLVATSNTSVSFTTSTENVTYTVAVQAQCYNSNTSSAWSTASSSNYFRPSSGGTITYNSGSGSWIAPAGVTSVTAYVWGAGGGGGTGCATYGGGGGGAFATKIVSVVAGNSYNYSVGAGVLVGNGGDSWFVNSSTVLAKGGAGSVNKYGGIGGQAKDSIPSTGAYSGGNGGDGDTDDDYGGGGGGGAGSGGDGGKGGNANGSYGSPGIGGIGTYPGGNGGGGTMAAGGLAPGGGGIGTDNYDCSTGGGGANGRIILVW